MRKLQVLIVDESAFFRRWFGKLILAIPGIQIIGEAKDPLSALRSTCRIKPDAIIIDAKARKRFGIDVLKHLRGSVPVPKVIMLTSDIYCRYQQNVTEKADFLLHKFTEYHKIPEILKRFASSTAPECKSPGPGFFGV